MESAPTFVTKSRYAKLLRSHVRRIKKVPDAILITSAGRPVPIFKIDEGNLAIFQRLKSELYGTGEN